MIKPIKRIELCDKDRQSLDAIREERNIKQSDQPSDYVNRVVVKPWGYEYMLFENDSVAIWFLNINKDHATSMHCHPFKKTSLTLLSGKALCNTFRHRNFLSSGDSLILDPGVFHSTKAMTLDGISLVEVETPPNKVDLVRLNDGYGRENCGYEGSCEMVNRKLEDYNYFYYNDEQCCGGKFTLEGLFSITMDTYSDIKEFQEKFTLDPGSLYCVCKGALLDQNDDIVVDVGDVERGTFLQDKGELLIGAETMLMKFSVF
jgi:mannose-6-phosphate isomerase-like protein (cupin superfamily)